MANEIDKAIAHTTAPGSVKDPLDMRRRLSFGKGTRTQNMIDEHAKAIQLNWILTNTTTSVKTIGISTFFDSVKNPTIYDNTSQVLADIGADYLLKNGDLYRGTGDASDEAVTAVSTDSNKPLNRFLRFAGTNPTRVVGLSMVSRNASTGQPEASNYDLKIRSIWSRFDDVPTINELNLKPLVPTGANFNTDRLNVNFIEQNFKFIISPEHFVTMQLAPNTSLALTVYVGAMSSDSQLFWRDINEADDVMRPVLLRQMR